MLTKKDKDDILKLFKMVDVKDMTIDYDNPDSVKWFRFGSYNGMQIASEIIKQMPERKQRKKPTVS